MKVSICKVREQNGSSPSKVIVQARMEHEYDPGLNTGVDMLEENNCMM